MSHTRCRREPRGYEQLTVSTTSIALAAVPTQAGTTPVTMTVIRVATANVRYRDDGTAPTASVGMPLLVDEQLEYDGPPQSLRFIRSGSADAVLNVSYYS